MSKRRVYISGQMTDLVPDDPEKNREEYMARFHRAEMLVANEGYWAVSPTRFAPCRWPWMYRLLERMVGRRTAYILVLLYDLWKLSQCNIIYKIPGWKESKGASIESCWAFHMGLWTLPTQHRERIDRRMAKFIEKRNLKLKEDE